MRKQDNIRFHEDMKDIYLVGYNLLSKNNLNLNEKNKLFKKLEIIIDKRIMYYTRKYKRADGVWCESPAKWDERNKKSLYNLYDKIKRYK